MINAYIFFHIFRYEIVFGRRCNDACFATCAWKRHVTATARRFDILSSSFTLRKCNRRLCFDPSSLTPQSIFYFHSGAYVRHVSVNKPRLFYKLYVRAKESRFWQENWHFWHCVYGILAILIAAEDNRDTFFSFSFFPPSYHPRCFLNTYL